jgi:hypothetical protein
VVEFADAREAGRKPWQENKALFLGFSCPNIPASLFMGKGM